MSKVRPVSKKKKKWEIWVVLGMQRISGMQVYRKCVEIGMKVFKKILFLNMDI